MFLKKTCLRWYILYVDLAILSSPRIYLVYLKHLYSHQFPPLEKLLCIFYDKSQGRKKEFPNVCLIWNILQVKTSIWRAREIGQWFGHFSCKWLIQVWSLVPHIILKAFPKYWFLSVKSKENSKHCIIKCSPNTKEMKRLTPNQNTDRTRNYFEQYEANWTCA